MELKLKTNCLSSLLISYCEYRLLGIMAFCTMLLVHDVNLALGVFDRISDRLHWLNSEALLDSSLRKGRDKESKLIVGFWNMGEVRKGWKIGT